MAFYGYHGALQEENRLGQRFFVDVTLYLPLEAAGKSDDLAHTVHYGEVFNEIKGIVEGPPFQLLEALAHTIAEKIFSIFSLVQELEIQIRKPEVPIAGILDYAAVEIRRVRNV